MYQNFIIKLSSDMNLNQYKFVNLKIHRSYLFEYEDTDIYALLQEYCPLNSDSEPELTNFLITSLDDTRIFRYAYYNNYLFIRTKDLIWIEDDNLFTSEIKINLLPKDENRMDKDLLLFTDEDLDDFTNDDESPFFIDLTDPYYSQNSNNLVDCSFMEKENDDISIRKFPPEYERFSKFEKSNGFYFEKSSGTWIKEDYDENRIDYIIDFEKLIDNNNRFKTLVEADMIDIHTEYKYEYSCSANKTHYIGILDNNIDTLMNFNCDDTFNKDNQSTIIYANQKGIDNHTNLNINDNDGIICQDDFHEDKSDYLIKTLLKYNNFDMIVLGEDCSSKKTVFKRDWDKELIGVI